MSSSLYLVFEYMEHDLSGLAAVQGVKVTEPQARVVTSCNFYAASCNFGMTNINPSLLQCFSSPFLPSREEEKRKIFHKPEISEPSSHYGARDRVCTFRKTNLFIPSAS